MKKDKLFSAKELGISLQNSMIFSSRPATLGSEIPEKRMAKLRAYCEAFIAPVVELVDDGALRAEEAVFMLSACALLAHQQLVVKSDKLPLAERGKK